jgi:hypothetical protein
MLKDMFSLRSISGQTAEQKVTVIPLAYPIDKVYPFFGLPGAIGDRAGDIHQVVTGREALCPEECLEPLH